MARRTSTEAHIVGGGPVLELTDPDDNSTPFDLGGSGDTATDRGASDDGPADQGESSESSTVYHDAGRRDFFMDSTGRQVRSRAISRGRRG